MKSRTRKLAWLLSATMLFTSVNPGMITMAAEENEAMEQSVEEETASVAEEGVASTEEEPEEAEALEDEEIEEDIVAAEPEDGQEQVLMAEEEQVEDSAKAIETYEYAVRKIERISNVDLLRNIFWAGVDTDYARGAGFEIYYEDGTSEELSMGGSEGGADLVRGGHIDFALKDAQGHEYPMDEYAATGSYTLILKDINGQSFELGNITVQNVRDHIKGEWTTTGSYEVTSNDKEAGWYKFTVPEDEKYFLKNGEVRILREKDGEVAETWSSTIYGKKGQVYYLGFEEGLYDDDGYMQSWTTELKKVREITNITDVKLAKDKFIARADWGFTHGAQIKVWYGENDFQIITFDRPDCVVDNDGNDIRASLEPQGDNGEYDDGEYDDDYNYGLYARLDAGTYHINFSVNGQTIGDGCDLNIVDVSEFSLPELSTKDTGTRISTENASSYLPSWYQFTAEQTGRYRIGGYQGYRVLKKNADGKLVSADLVGDRLFKAEKDETYYLGFWGSITDIDDGTSYTENIRLTPVAGVTNITATPEKTTFYAGERGTKIWAKIAVNYEKGDSETLDAADFKYGGDDGGDTNEYVYVPDSNGNEFVMYLQKEGSDREYNYIDEIMEAGNYTVHIYWMENPNVEAHYTIQVLPVASPFEDAGVPVSVLELGNPYTVELTENNPVAWFKYTPQADCTAAFTAMGDNSYDTYAEIYDADGDLLEENDDSDNSFHFELVYKLSAGKTYYYRTRMYNMGEYGKFNVSLTLKDHSHTYAEDRKEATCTTAGYTQQKCSSCGEVKAGSYAVLPAKGHSFGGYVETTHPTALTEGVQIHTCTVCGYSENATVGRLAANVTLSASTLPLQVKQSASITKLITAMTTGDRLVSCTTSNKKIATVNNAGKVTGKKAGKAKITMNFASGLSKTVTVKVQKAKVATSKITNIPGSITLKVKNTYKLSPVIAPITTKDKASYKTANKKIATVAKNGKITAKKAGKTTITVKVGKKTKKVKVTVTK